MGECKEDDSFSLTKSNCCVQQSRSSTRDSPLVAKNIAMDIESGEITAMDGVRKGETYILPRDSLINNGATNFTSKWAIVREAITILPLKSKWSRKMAVETIKWVPSVLSQPIETNTRGFPEREISSTTGTRPSIFNVPDTVELIPIGPYHSPTNREKALINVSKKWVCANYLIEYFGLNIFYCMARIEKEEARIRSYYAESLLSDYTGEVLKELFFLDSCFICYFIYIVGGFDYQYRSKTKRTNSMELIMLQNIMDQHVLSDITSNENQIKIELLMLGNQIPWFLIEIINDCFKNTELPPVFTALACFENIYPRMHNHWNGFASRAEGFQHLLHVFHWSRVPSSIDSKPWRHTNSIVSSVYGKGWYAFNRFARQIKLGAQFICFKRRIKRPHSSDSSDHENHFFPAPSLDAKKDEDSIDLLKLETSLCVPNAVELHESSTSFRRLWGSLDIAFHRKIIWPSATMHISPLHIFDYSSTIYKHLINFEQKYQKCGFHVTGHMTCIARLLQSKEDVNLLRKKSILPNTMKNDLEILSFVREMRVETRGGRVPRDLRNFYRRVTKHRDGKFNKAYGGFKHHYCPNPWITLSVLGGIGLFILTLLQTIFTIIGNKKP